LDIVLDDWTLRSNGSGYEARVSCTEFELTLNLTPTQNRLLHGEAGWSRKSPSAASYYYSSPQLIVSGSVKVRGRSQSVSGVAWFDHEWSNDYVDERAVGWDWLGINMLDGSALMAFRMRGADGTIVWNDGTFRRAGAAIGQPLRSIEWQPSERWRSPRTAIEYPIAWRLRVGSEDILIVPMLRDQENDARGSVGILYWEGAVEARSPGGELLGRGYLELTGYDQPVRL
jgi:predicted secreted hydrolase